MPNTLIVSYYFPPVNSIASLRIYQFAYWLPYYNWIPTILTAENIFDNPCDLTYNIDSSKIIRISGHDPIGKIKKVIKKTLTTLGYYNPEPHKKYTDYKSKTEFIKKINPITNVRCPDIAMWWQKKAIKAGLNHISNKRPDIIFSSCGPPSSHIVASKLSKLSKIPWVADYRDLWSWNHMQKRNKTIQFCEEKYERYIVKDAVYFTTVSQDLSDQLACFFNTAGRVSVIHNGYDPEIYQSLIPAKSNKFTISYTGNLYPHQDPHPFIASIKKLKEKATLSSNSFEARFYGINLNNIEQLAERYGVSDIVKCKGYIPYNETIQNQVDSDILLLFGWQNKNQKGILTGKLFEYLGAKRPILCIGPGNDEIETILHETNAGHYCRNEQETFDTLNDWINQWMRTGTVSFHPDDNCVADFSRKRLTRKLAKVFNTVLANGRGN